MKKLVLFALVAVAIAAPAASAQETASPVTARNAFYVELLGNGILYSLNYDRMITPKVSARVGVAALAAADDSTSAGVVAAPIMVNYLFGEGNSHFETGVGLMLASGAVDEVGDEEDDAFSGAVGTATLGYRYQRPGGGFVFRAGLTPFFSTDGILPWFGVSFGYGW